MKLRRNPILSYVLVALGICLIVNFSYLLLLVVDRSGDVPRRPGISKEQNEIPVKQYSGSVSINRDSFGYVISPSGDSVFISRFNTRLLQLKDGDTVEIEAARNNPDTHFELRKVLKLNGSDFDYGALYSSPARMTEMFFQIIFYFMLSLLLLFIMGTKGSILPRVSRNYDISFFARRAALAIAVSCAAYFLAPIAIRQSGQTIMLYQSTSMIDFVVMLKCSFTLIVVILYSQVYALTYQRQEVILENEQLKNENLTTKYNMLMSQINPHFLFNSLSSLSMLIREGDKSRATEYIDQLSYTFRYITQQGSSNTMVTLDEEMEFAKAYCYLFKIRYEDKLEFDIDIDPKYGSWMLPALSLQPLIGNSVKHNAISSKRPLKVDIFTENGMLVIHNPIQKLLKPQVGTLTGLSNLRSRYNLMAQADIEVIETETDFTVKLPLRHV